MVWFVVYLSVDGHVVVRQACDDLIGRERNEPARLRSIFCEGRHFCRHFYGKTNQLATHFTKI